MAEKKEKKEKKEVPKDLVKPQTFKCKMGKKKVLHTVSRVQGTGGFLSHAWCHR